MDSIANQIKTRQYKEWQAIEGEYIECVIHHFVELAQVLAVLLKNDSYVCRAYQDLR